MNSHQDDELLIWSESSIDAGPVPSGSRSFGDPGSWLGLVGLVILVVGGVWFIGRSDGAVIAPTQRVSGAAAPLVNELRWSGPFQVEGAADIEHLLVEHNVVYGLVDGWIATTTDLLLWEHLPLPAALNRDQYSDDILASFDEFIHPSFTPVLGGQVLDYDVLGDVVIALVVPPLRVIDPTAECFVQDERPVMDLYVSFDRGNSWDELELPGVRPVGELFFTSGSGVVATDGVTAMASIAITRVPSPACVSEAFGVSAKNASASRSGDEIIFIDAAGNRGAIPTDVLSDADRAVLSEPERIASHFVISPELTTAPAVGRPGPLLEADRDEYIIGFGGIPAQLSKNHGQSFVELDRDRGLSVRRDIVLQPAGGGTRISADYGVTWTAPHLDFAATLDAVRWNNRLYVLTTSIKPGGPVEPGGVTLHSTQPGSEVTEQLEEFRPVGMSALTMYNDRLVVLGTTTGDDGSQSQIVYFGDRPFTAS